MDLQYNGGAFQQKVCPVLGIRKNTKVGEDEKPCIPSNRAEREREEPGKRGPHATRKRGQAALCQKKLTERQSLVCPRDERSIPAKKKKQPDRKE